MKERYKNFAADAGFALWDDEAWNPGDVVDWNSRYDAELEKFGELIDADWQFRYNELLSFCDRRIQHLEELVDRSMSMNKTLVDKLK